MLAKTFRRLNLLVYGGILLAVVIYGFVLLPRGYFEVARLKTQDLFFRTAHLLNPLPAQIRDLVVVDIDDESLSMVNQKWPWEREQYAAVLDQIKAANPRVIAFDIVFLGKSVNVRSDEAFASSLRAAGDVVLASYCSENGSYVKPMDVFSQAACAFGMINKPRDPDNLVRRARLWMKEEPSGALIDYTFETEILCRYYRIGTNDVKILPNQAKFMRPWSVSGESAQDIQIPLAKDGTFLINYIACEGDIPRIPIWRIMRGDMRPAEFKDKIVLIGQSNEIIHDIHPTPLGQMPGVFITANVLLTILSSRFIHEIPPFVSALELLFFTLLTFWVTLRLNVLRGALACVGMLLLHGLYSFFLFQHNFVGDFFSIPACVPAIFIGIRLYKSVTLFIENLSLKQDAITDGLTGLYIHRYLLVRLENELDRACRYQHKLSVAMMDIDFFKKFNDTYGHEEGNNALIHVARIMRESFRKVDLLFRYGGEEFCVILPGNDAATAMETVERFRKKLESTALTVGDKAVSLRISIGLVSYTDSPVQDMHELLRCADRALYEAKKAGRNRTCLFR